MVNIIKLYVNALKKYKYFINFIETTFHVVPQWCFVVSNKTKPIHKFDLSERSEESKGASNASSFVEYILNFSQSSVIKIEILSWILRYYI